MTVVPTLLRLLYIRDFKVTDYSFSRLACHLFAPHGAVRVFDPLKMNTHNLCRLAVGR